jgi:hypothetical protein
MAAAQLENPKVRAVLPCGKKRTARACLSGRGRDGAKPSAWQPYDAVPGETATGLLEQK